MPLHKTLTLRNPSVIQSATNFSRLSEMEVALSTYGSYVRGDNSRRGSVYVDLSGNLEPVLLQGLAGASTASPMVIQSSGFTNFETPGDLVGPGTSFASILSVHYFGGYFWALGLDTGGAAKVVALINGFQLYASTGWTNRSTDFSVGDQPIFLRRSSSGKMWCAVFNSGTSTIRVMTTTSVSSAFTSETIGTVSTATLPTAYEIDDTGTVQMVFFGSSGYRTLNSGGTWTSITAPGSVTDVTYSKASRVWCITNAGQIPFYSTDSGVTWLPSYISGKPGLSLETTGQITHLERLDSDGYYLLLVAGYDGTQKHINTYISEDGGLSWVISQVLRVPNYGTGPMPSLPQIVLVNSNRVWLYQCSRSSDWNFDNSCFVTPLTNFSNL